jgi:hypothetical protein
MYVHKQRFVLTTGNWKQLKETVSGFEAVNRLSSDCRSGAAAWHSLPHRHAMQQSHQPTVPQHSVPLQSVCPIQPFYAWCIGQRWVKWRRMAGDRTWPRNHSNHSVHSTENYDERTTEGVVKQPSGSTASVCDDHKIDAPPKPSQWWTVNLSETCRVLYQIKLRNSAGRWLLL